MTNLQTNPQTEEKIVAIISDIVELEPEEIDPTADIAVEYDVDSLRALEILVEMEKAFSVRIPESKLPEMRTVRAIAQMVQ